ncbi:uncharacterized protein [Rhodnius prolixus]|uniref:uncharacterized protein n=1 Tax=Rhodnius prolixus TaxID=13249 RepID=UPI003D189A61
MSKNSEDICSPKLSKGKRQRSNSSPETEEEVKRREKYIMASPMEQVGNMNVNQLSELFDLKLKNMATKQDISILSAQLELLRHEHSTLKLEIKKQQDINRKLRSQMEFTQMEVKRNNLIFKGITMSPEEDCLQKVKNLCLNLLNTPEDITIYRAQPIGNKNASKKIILAEFPKEAERINILKNARILRGTGISVEKDLTGMQRDIKRKLLYLRKCIKETNPKLQVSVWNQNLFINNSRFHWIEEEGLIFGRECGISKLKEITNYDFSTVIQKLLSEVSAEKLNLRKEEMGEDKQKKEDQSSFRETTSVNVCNKQVV